MSKHGLAAGHANPDAEVNLGIIITPMLDMAFQLLAFFVMIFRPPSYEAQININLLPPEKLVVKGKAPPKNPADPPPSAEPDPAVRDLVMVIVKSYDKELEEGKNPDARVKAGKTKDGMPLKILIKTPESPEAKEVAGEGDPIEKGFEKFLIYLKDIKKTMPVLPAAPGKQKQDAVKTEIKLMLDGGLKYRYVVQIWDICQVAGFKGVGFIAPTDLPSTGAPSFKNPIE